MGLREVWGFGGRRSHRYPIAGASRRVGKEEVKQTAVYELCFKYNERKKITGENTDPKQKIKCANRCN